MSGLDNLNKRISYRGGADQVDRMKEEKLRTLKKALLYSYQAATAILEDEREFKCLINPNKMSTDVDDKVISIPFEDICLNADKVGKTTEGIETIGLKAGDTFEWKENGTHWIVTLQYKNELAYFRAQIRECKEQVEINGHKYWCYVRGPVEQTLVWQQVEGNRLNQLNYTLLMYITNNEETEQYFHRFSKVEIAGKPWEVQAVDNISTVGIIEIALKETFQNTIEKENLQEQEEPVVDKTAICIIGDKIIRPYDIKEFKIQNISGGNWSLEDTKKAVIKSQTDTSALVEVLTGKSGNITLKYKYNDTEILFPITIKSL
jgi:hypothetical protein